MRDCGSKLQKPYAACVFGILVLAQILSALFKVVVLPMLWVGHANTGLCMRLVNKCNDLLLQLIFMLFMIDTVHYVKFKFGSFICNIAILLINK